ncbi:NUDIX domain-containing protein [Paenibacillus sp. JNUCC31]|nr:NUDIX domain-containing protein [Paenibacillus sp. JNUCC-31]
MQTKLPLAFQSTRVQGNKQTEANIDSRLLAAEESSWSDSEAKVTADILLQPRIGVGAVILNERNEVLLVWRNRQPEQYTWSIPGGKVDPYESLETAVIREIKEEVDLEIAIEGLLCTAETIRPEQEEHWISVLYFARVIHGIARNLEEGGAIGEIGWFPLNELPSPLASFTVPGLKAVMQLYSKD